MRVQKKFLGSTGQGTQKMINRSKGNFLKQEKGAWSMKKTIERVKQVKRSRGHRKMKKEQGKMVKKEQGAKNWKEQGAR